MFTIEFEYYNNEIGSYETDSIECRNYNDFKIWVSDNNITNYEILEIYVD